MSQEKFRPTRTPAWAKNMQKLGPGFYVDQNKAIHISEPEICEALGVPYTRANSNMLAEVIEQMKREHFPNATTERVNEP